MSDTDIDEQTTEAAGTREQRERIDRLTAESKAKDERIAELERLRTEAVLKEVGLDPGSTAAEGLLTLHKDRELTVEAIRETASTYSIAVPGVSTTPISDVAAQALHQTDTANQLAGVSTVSAPPPDLDQRITEATKAGDVQAVIALKASRAESIAG